MINKEIRSTRAGRNDFGGIGSRARFSPLGARGRIFALLAYTLLRGTLKKTHMKDQAFAGFDEMPDAVLVVERNSTIVHSTGPAKRVFGYRRGSSLSGFEVDSLMPKRKKRKARRGFSNVLE